MTDNDPFAPPPQNFVIPTPGARANPQPGSAAPNAAPAPTQDLGALDWSAGLNPLVAAASPLLNLVPQLRVAHHADPLGLRERVARAIQTFEAKAREAGVLNEHVIGARYALCSFLDEAAANTPWGEKVWAQRSLLVQFHNEAWGGEKAFQLLGKLAEQPGTHRNLLELFYLILALGFEGRFRVIQNGRAQLDAVRERLAQLLMRERGEPQAELSPAWRSDVRSTPRLRDSFPLWAMAAIAAMALFVVYFGASWLLNRQSDPAFSGILALRVPPPPAPRQQPAPQRLQHFLAEEIRANQLEVRDLADRSIVLLRGDGLFAPGSASLSEQFRTLLPRIGDAIARVNGSVQVLGHSDNVPIRSARFPSNWHLSQARADAVAQALSAKLAGLSVEAQGRADSEPVASNTTPEGRARNRRVEIIVFPAAGSAGGPAR